MIFLIWADPAHVRELGQAEAPRVTSCRIDQLSYRQPDSAPAAELLETDRELAPPDSVLAPEPPETDREAGTTSEMTSTSTLETDR